MPCGVGTWGGSVTKGVSRPVFRDYCNKYGNVLFERNPDGSCPTYLVLIGRNDVVLLDLRDFQEFCDKAPKSLDRFVTKCKSVGRRRHATGAGRGLLSRDWPGLIRRPGEFRRFKRRSDLSDWQVACSRLSGSQALSCCSS